MNDRHQITPYPLRLPIEMRKQLEGVAREGGRSLQTEILRRLMLALSMEPTGLEQAQIMISIPKALHEKLRLAATESGQQLNDEVRKRLEESFSSPPTGLDVPRTMSSSPKPDVRFVSKDGSITELEIKSFATTLLSEFSKKIESELENKLESVVAILKLSNEKQETQPSGPLPTPAALRELAESIPESKPMPATKRIRRTKPTE